MHSFRDKPLFEGLSLTFSKNERVVITGPNGSGKSTLLKILAGDLTPDEGEVITTRGLHIVRVAQSCHYEDKTIFEILQEVCDDFVLIDKTLSIAGLSGELRAPSLSGGMLRRLSICEAFVKKPDVLLLDEPTNHLDTEGLLWLESTLKMWNVTWIAVTHDRAFMEELATRVIEVAPRYSGGVFESEGNYSTFLDRRSAFFQEQTQLHQSLASRARIDEAWLRQGPKARATRDQGRVKQAMALKEELSSLKQSLQANQSRLQFEQGEKRGKVLVSAHELSFQYGDQVIVNRFDFMLKRGTRLGILGENGAGKSTLLRLLMKELKPQQGLVKHVDGLKVAYLDQMRVQINPEWTLAQALCPEGDMVSYPGGQCHVTSWAQRFCLNTNQLKTFVKNLSGGELARVHVAQLMRQPADILVLDEPTNDLDIDTIEKLEEALQDFSGSLLIVSHDRWFLDHLCHFVLAPDAQKNGTWTLCADRKQAIEVMVAPKPVKKTSASHVVPKKQEKNSKKSSLSWKEQKELATIEKTIAKQEQKVEELEVECAAPELQDKADLLQKIWTDLDQARKRVEDLYARWEELEAKKAEV